MNHISWTWGVASKRVFKKFISEFPLWLSRNQSNRSVTMRTHVCCLALLSGLRIRGCCELWCRSQTWLGSGVAVAVV